MKKIWVNRVKSFREAEEFNQDYYSKMSRAERLEIMQFLREIYYKIKKGKNENGKRLRRIAKAI